MHDVRPHPSIQLVERFLIISILSGLPLLDRGGGFGGSGYGFGYGDSYGNGGG